MNSSWEDEALCAQTDPEAHYPEPGGTSRDAKRTCLACEVRTECLEYAISTEQRFGVWGGVSQQELRRLVQARHGEAA